MKISCDSGCPLWTSLISPVCNDGDTIAPLKAAIFTTFEAPDTAFLAEEFLPEMLGLERKPTDESNDLFWAELTDKLKGTKIAIISSFGKEISNDYKWLWKHVSHHTTGSDKKAVQHAKLWLLHRQNETSKAETLEIYVSSANLTKSAFKNQIQSAWRASIPLSNKSTKTNLESWGILPNFLEELGKSCANKDLINYFIELLKRGKAPKGVTFLASVPGNYRSKWGTYGLAKLKDELDTRSSTEIGIIVPYVGKWDENDLKYWTFKIGSSPDNLTLMWVDKNNHMANSWRMPKETFEQLKHCGANIRRLLPSDNNGYGKTHCIHDKQPQNDTRWSHSKIYELKRGKSRRIIITSANFSSSAWGKRKKNYLKINNFEFGVAISGEYNWSIIENEHLPDNSNELNLNEAYLEEDNFSESDEKGLVWASAEWNGEKIDIKASTASSTKYPDETVIVFAEKNGMAEVIKKNKWKRDNHLWEWSTKWVHKKDGMPFFVSIKYNSEIYKITLNDLRNDEEKDSDPIPEVDPKISQKLKDDIFLEQFNGPYADNIGKNQEEALEDNDKQDKFKTRQNNGKNNSESDYSLPWLIQAREWFNIIDSWDEKCKSSSIDIEQSGNKLIEIICRQKINLDVGTCIAAEVVANEIKMRMR